jgi:hypothetical protein
LIPTILAGIETAFGVGNEFVTVGTYDKSTGTGVYNPVMDDVVPGQTRYDNVRFLKTTTDVTEREASPVGITDSKFLVPSVDFPQGFLPGENDKFAPGDGVVYNVIASRPLPGNVLFIIFGRRA